MRWSTFGASLFLLGAMASAQAINQGCPNAVDYVDPIYEGWIRQLVNPEGHEHNLYHYRNPWNADNTYLLGIHSDLQQQNWRVVLYDGDGCFIRELYTLDQYDWRVAWERNDPAIFYTWKGSNLYQYNVTTGEVDLLKSFAPLRIGPAGPSVNQAGDRIMVVTSDGVIRSYRLPDMQEERMVRPAFPPGCAPSEDNKERYTGYRNYIVTQCVSSSDPTRQAMFIYDDTGVLFRQFDGLTHGHADFSPDGQFAYGTLPSGRDPDAVLGIHVVNIDGTNDRMVYRVPRSEASYVQNFHITWPSQVNEWFVVSLFPSAQHLPATYAPLLDEILLMRTGMEAT